MLELLIAAAFTTRCNVYYNSATPLHRSVSCQATFTGGRLSRVNFYLPNAGRYYDWSTTQRDITPDPRWRECLRYTYPESGNQYQICVAGEVPYAI